MIKLLIENNKNHSFSCEFAYDIKIKTNIKTGFVWMGLLFKRNGGFEIQSFTKTYHGSHLRGV